MNSHFMSQSKISLDETAKEKGSESPGGGLSSFMIQGLTSVDPAVCI